MHFTYSLNKADILEHQLYILSESKSFQKRRAKGRMFLLLIYMVSGVFIWQRSGAITAAAFYVICFPFYFIYRKLEGNQYKKHISGFVDQQYKDALDNEFHLEWDDKMLTSSAGDKSHQATWMELESVVELSSLFILNFRNSNALIIPKKDPVLQDVIRTDLKTKTEALGVPYEEKLNWKWN
jgi:hypothetical protein